MNDQNSALEGLNIAIQMELDGKEFYLTASRESGNKLGKDLFNALAEEEDQHRRRFEDIFEKISNRHAWPKLPASSGSPSHIKTLFKTAKDRIGTDIRAATNEIDAVQTAMVMENETYDFYKEQAGQASHEAEKEYYEALASEERRHYLALADYHELLSDPAGWFAEKEHPSLDGG